MADDGGFSEIGFPSEMTTMNHSQELGDALISTREFGLLLCADSVDFTLSPPVYNDIPNLHAGCNPNYEDLPNQYSGYPTEPTPIDSPYGQFPEHFPVVVDNTFSDRYFVVLDNIYRLSADGTIQPHQELNPPALAPIIPNPVKPNSGFHVGVLPFYIDKFGQLYSIREEQGTFKFDPKPVFNTEDGAWVSLGIGENPIPSPEHNLLAEASPATPFENVLDSNFDEMFGAPDFAPLLSPATSESCTLESTSEPNTPEGYPPLFPNPGSEILTDSFVSPDLSSPPATAPPLLPPSSPGGINTEFDVDDHVTSLKAKRRRRGVRPSPVALQCPVCGKVCRRPHELKEHMNGVHLGLRPFKCPRVGCPKDYGTDSNRTRHLRKCTFPVE